MTRKYTNTGKLKETNIRIRMESDPSLTRDEAYELWKADMRARASKGGKAPTGGFKTVPGLAQRAGRISRNNRKK